MTRETEIPSKAKGFCVLVFSANKSDYRTGSVMECALLQIYNLFLHFDDIIIAEIRFQFFHGKQHVYIPGSADFFILLDVINMVFTKRFKNNETARPQIFTQVCMID